LNKKTKQMTHLYFGKRRERKEGGEEKVLQEPNHCAFAYSLGVSKKTNKPIKPRKPEKK
jgi:hypothetical protein